MQIAPLGIRAVAAIIDLLVLAVLWTVFGIFAGNPPASGYGFNIEGLPALAGFAATFAYYAVTDVLWGGTPGKMLTALRVVDADTGERIDWSKSIIRNLLRIVDAIPTLYLVGFLFALSSPKSQRLGDRVARTVVVRL